MATSAPQRQKHISRHDARRKAFELLFELEQHPGLDTAEALERSFEPDIAAAYLTDVDKEGYVAGAVDAENQKFISSVVLAVTQNLSAIDTELARYPIDWSFDRLGRVERVLLRMALAEMAVVGTPEKIVINEIVELAKQYADEEAAKFLNGILGSAVANIEAMRASLTGNST
jgi:N utilization substance protein B